MFSVLAAVLLSFSAAALIREVNGKGGGQHW